VESLVLSPVPEDELPTLEAGADVFRFPSTQPGFALVAMEPAVALPTGRSLRHAVALASTLHARRREDAGT
jgi:hypothetical protein